MIRPPNKWKGTLSLVFGDRAVVTRSVSYKNEVNVWAKRWVILYEIDATTTLVFTHQDGTTTILSGYL